MSENARYHSREELLLKFYNQRNFNDRIGFYKSNDFRNTLEYYVDKNLVQVLSRSKELAFKFRDDRDPAFNMLVDGVERILKMGLPVSEGLPVPVEEAILKDEKSIDIAANFAHQEDRFKDVERVRDFARTTTDALTTLLLRLLQQNDNCDNPFDDAYWLKNILEALGRCDDFSKLAAILKEVEKYLKIDAGPRSVHGAVSKGAISCYFGLRKGIWRYLYLKKPLLAVDVYAGFLQDAETQAALARIEQRIPAIIGDRRMSMDLRLFVFKKLVKSKFQYSSEPLCMQHELAVPGSDVAKRVARLDTHGVEQLCQGRHAKLAVHELVGRRNDATGGIGR